MKLKHTPGPWRACSDTECSCGLIWAISTDITVVAHTQINVLPNCIKNKSYNLEQERDNHFKEFKANIKLVAKAPELLEALINSTKELNRLNPDSSHGVLQMMQSIENEELIKQITGKTLKEILEN